ncbi:MAG TPA: ABC transporter ATP-binding protein [Acidobacteria bacterium]|nr:ABC transporter ATP-binding protein [Acidobacteriota bacterium]
MIHIEKLVKVYGGFRAVDGLSLQVGTGQILGLVGPNGAGKTTTLRCLAGIIPPTSGRVTIAGFDLQTHPLEARKRLAFVPDEPHLFDHLTALDHLTLFSRLYGVADGPARAEALLEEAGLGDQRLSFPSELSRGMKQKLVVACALLHRPEVLVLDEPLTGLDPAAMRRMKRTVRDTARAGASVIVSSHMLQLVEEVCDRVLIVNHGKKVLIGTLDEIRLQFPDVDADADLETLFMRATGADQ